MTKYQNREKMKRLHVDNVDPKFVAYYVGKYGLRENDLEIIPGRYQHKIAGEYADKIGRSLVLKQGII